jgi:hypothetical protein
VIFRHQPKQDEVVLNLERLMQHERFWPSIERWEAQGVDFGKGVRKWATTQHEVILTVETVPHQEFYALGSNAAQSILEGSMGEVEIIGETMRSAEEVSQAFAEAGLPTKRWLFDDSARRAYERWVQRILDRLDP